MPFVYIAGQVRTLVASIAPSEGSLVLAIINVAVYMACMFAGYFIARFLARRIIPASAEDKETLAKQEEEQAQWLEQWTKEREAAKAKDEDSGCDK